MEKKKEPLCVVPPMLKSNVFPIVADPLGSYTGIVRDPMEEPVQDADDL